MKSGILKKSLIALCLAALLAPCIASATYVSIDSFNGGLIQSQSLLPSPQLVYGGNSGLATTQTLFGARHTFDYVYAGSSPGYTASLDINRLNSGVYSHSTEDGVQARSALFIDGTGGLTGSLQANTHFADLTAGGSNNVIQLDIEHTDYSPKITLIFRDMSNNTIVYKVNSGVIPVFATNFVLNLSMSDWAGIDFKHINGFQMLVDGAAGMDTRINAVGATSTVPEPGTFVLLGAGLVGAVFMKRRSKKTV